MKTNQNYVYGNPFPNTGTLGLPNTNTNNFSVNPYLNVTNNQPSNLDPQINQINYPSKYLYNRNNSIPLLSYNANDGIPPKTPSQCTLPPINNSFRSYSSNLEKYQSAYNDCRNANQLIQRRLDKIQLQRQMLLDRQNNVIIGRNYYSSGEFNPYNPYFASNPAFFNESYKQAISNSQGKLYGSPVHPQQMMEPIYYPLELPVSGEPIQLPNIEVGKPSDNKNNKLFNFAEVCALLTAVEDNEFDFKDVTNPEISPFLHEILDIKQEKEDEKEKMEAKAKELGVDPKDLQKIKVKDGFMDKIREVTKAQKLENQRKLKEEQEKKKFSS